MPAATQVSYTARTNSSVNWWQLIRPPSRIVQSSTLSSGRYVIQGAVSDIRTSRRINRIAVEKGQPNVAGRLKKIAHAYQAAHGVADIVPPRSVSQWQIEWLFQPRFAVNLKEYVLAAPAKGGWLMR